METKMKKYILSKGLVLGGIVAAILLLEYVISKDLMLNWWAGILVGYGVPLTYIVFAVTEYRKKINDDYIEFKEAFSVSFGISAVMSFVYVLVAILLYNVIDPSMVDFMVDGISDQMIKWMSAAGSSEKDIKEALKGIDQMREGFKPLGMLKSTFWGLALWAVFSLLIAAATKKSRPMFDDDTLN